MSEPICTVMVGLPALGKSTIIESMYYPDAWIYSTDNYIETCVNEYSYSSYDEAFPHVINAATKTMNEGLEYAIQAKMDIIWDQTNLGVRKRQKIINRMKQAGYRVCCICIVPPEAGWLDDQKTWAHRLRSREGKTIPHHVLSNMIESFVEPTIEEGFDTIYWYSMHGALLKIDYSNNSK